MDSQKVAKKRRKRKKRSKRSEGLSTEPSTSSDGGTQHVTESNSTEPSAVPAIKSNDLRGKRKRDSMDQSKTKDESLQVDSTKHYNRKRQKPREPAPHPNYPFEVDATDHCETPLEAYRDVVSLLDRVATSLGKTRSSLTIYDPYYCDGGVRQKLNSLGFSNVTNVNEDFYVNIEKKSVPEYDVLVTNPPYSGVHMEKLLTFVAASRKPYLLLLPHYVYTKDYYQQAFRSNNTHPFFLVPKARYAYLPPAWVEKGSTALDKGKIKTAPFPSFWYCHVDKVPTKWLIQTYGTSGVYRHDQKIQYAACTAHIPRDMKGEFDSSKKRPNPKARKRAAAKKYAAMAGP